MIEILASIVGGPIASIIGALAPYLAILGGVIAAWFFGKRSGAKGERQRREIEDLTDERDTLRRRDEITEDMRYESDDDLRARLGIERR